MTSQEKPSNMQALIALFNSNLKYINREMSLSVYLEMKEQFQAEDHGHLAKILSLRGITL